MANEEQLSYFQERGIDTADLEFKLLPILADEGAPPKGVYVVKATASYKLSAALNDMVNITFEVLSPEEFAGQRVFDRLMFSEKPFPNGKACPLTRTLQKLENVFSADWVHSNLKGDLIDDLIPAIIHQFEDMEMCVKVTQREEEYEGSKSMRNRITQYYPVDAYEGE